MFGALFLSAIFARLALDALPCSNADITDLCIDPCPSLANGGSACQTYTFFDPLNPPIFDYSKWKCACLVGERPTGVCEEWNIQGCGTWCYYVWAAAGCSPGPACPNCYFIEASFQVCTAQTDCRQRYANPCEGPGGCEKFVSLILTEVYITGTSVCCP